MCVKNGLKGQKRFGVCESALVSAKKALLFVKSALVCVKSAVKGKKRFGVCKKRFGVFQIILALV